MRRKARSREESGTCNVCSTPCSSCMHLRRMGSKGNEFSDETSRVTATSLYSVTEDDTLPPFQNKMHESSQPTTSEASNLLSINSSHDSLSENAESKENIRVEIADASVESNMPPNLRPVGNAAVHEDCKSVEGHDENISCVSGSHEMSAQLKDVGRKNLSCSSGLVSSLGTQVPGKTVFSKEESLELPPNNRDSSCGPSKLQNNVKNALNGDPCKVSNKIHLKSESDAKKDSREQPDEGSSHADLVDRGEKLNERVESPDIKEPALASGSGDETDESEIMEHDVKVCDICGDAGREDLLAICSRCSDGAEHTYCMREMLQKVPEGDWLCEECKLAEENDNLKQGSDVEGKSKTKASTQSSGKRHVEAIGVASTSFKRALETSSGSPKLSSPKRMGTLSRDSSFNSSDKGKVKPANQNYNDDHLGIEVSDNVRAHAFGSRLQTPKGTLLKSNSFNTINSKPKVKTVDEVPQKLKGARESSLDMKEAPARTISKSMSFKSVSTGRSNATESKVKMLSPKISHAQDIKVLKHKDRTALERKTLSKLERPLGSPMVTSLNNVDQKLTPRGDYRDTKTTPSDGKFSTLSRSTSSIARKSAENSVSSARASSTSGMSNASAEHKLNQVSPKEEPSSSSSWIAEKHSYNVNESATQGEKTRENSGTRSRPVTTTGLKPITCQKCKDIGHAAESCIVSSPRASFSDSATARGNREDVSKRSKLKAAIEAAMLKKPGIYRKKNTDDQSDGLSTYNGDVSREVATQDKVSVANKTENMISDEDTKEGQANHEFLSPVAAKFGHASVATSVPVKMPAIPEHEFIWQGAFEMCRVGKVVDLHTGMQAHLSTCASPKVIEVVNKFPQKLILDEVPCSSMWPRQFHENGAKDDNIALYFFAKDIDSYEKHYKTLLDNMIKKDLALRGYFDGVELLIFASTQLPEHSQRWNMLFFLWGVFRGKRYQYSPCLEKPLIPSLNVVPVVKDIPSADPSAPENIHLAESIHKEPIAHDDSCNVILASSSPNNSFISLNGEPDNKLSSTQKNLEQQDWGLDPKALPKIMTSNGLSCSEAKSASLSQEEAGHPEMRSDAEFRPSVHANGTNNGSGGQEKIQMHGDASHVREEKPSVKIFDVPNQGLGATGSREKPVDRMSNDRDEDERNLNEGNGSVDIEAHLRVEDQTMEELVCWQSSNNKKRTYLDLSEPAPESSTITSKEPMWNKVDSLLANSESFNKKLKTGSSEPHGCGILKGGNCLSDSLNSRTGDWGSSSSVEEMICDKTSDTKVSLEDLGTTERYFFPVESHDVTGFRSGASSMSWREYSSNIDERHSDGVPNLELALGAETKPSSRGILPFFVGMVEENDVQNKPVEKATEKEEDDSVSASLSLSLSFPFPDKEQTMKPVSKPDQVLPERQHVNTSLLLFGKFTDK